VLKLLIKAAICLALAVPVLLASPPQPAPRRTASPGVDFSDPAQAQVFYSRLRAAAGEVCDGYGANSRGTRTKVACVERTIAQSLRKLDRPVLASPVLAGPDERRPPTRLAGR
jgi:UrcA family protein